MTGKQAFVGVLLFSSVCAALLLERDALSCDRGAGTCRVTRRRLYRTFERSFPVSDLEGAELAEMPGRDSERTRGRRIVILTRQEQIPLMGYSSSLLTEAMKRDVAAISRYATTPSETRLDIRYNSGVVALIAGAVAFVFAGALALALLDKGKPAAKPAD